MALITYMTFLMHGTGTGTLTWDDLCRIKDYPDFLNDINETPGKEILLNPYLTHLPTAWVNGKAYSNTNHLWSTSYYPSSAKEKVYLSDQIKKPLLAKILKDKTLYYKVTDHVEFCCNYYNCWNCCNCLKDCETLEEIEEVVNWSLYY